MVAAVVGDTEMARKLYTTKDKAMNATLASQVAGVRGAIFETAEQSPMPNRFDAVPHPDRPAMIITDIVTGKAAIVPLFAYRAARDVLFALFS
jgi:hypothetical protein